MAFDFDNDGLPVQSAGGGFDFDEEGAPVRVAEKAGPEEGGFAASAKQAVGATIKGAGQLAADFIPGIDSDNAVSRYGQEVIDANPTAVRSLDDIKDKPWTAVKEGTGNAASSVAQVVGARAVGMGITAASPLAGPAAPAVALIGQIVSWLGPAAVAALPSYGSIREKQILKDPALNDDMRSKAIAALGAATVGAIETKFGPQEWALSALTKEGRKAMAEKFAETTAAKAIGFGAAKGAVVEGGEELVQNPVEQLASYDDPTTPENVKDTLFGGAMGAIGGGVLGGGTGAVTGRQQQTPKVDDILTAPTVDQAIAAADAVLAAPLEPVQGAGLAPPNQLMDAARGREAGEVDLNALIESETRNLQVLAAQLEQETRKQTDLDQLQQTSRQDLGRLPDQQVAAAEVATDENPTAMQLAMQRALARQAEKPDVSAPPAVQESPASPAAGWDFDAPAGVDADVGTGVPAQRALDARGATNQPARAALPLRPAGDDQTLTQPTGTPQNVQVETPFTQAQTTPAPAEPGPVPKPRGAATDLEAIGVAQKDGTALIRGDVPKILDELKRQGFTAVLKRQGGVLVGRSQAQRALEVFKAPAQKVETEAITEVPDAAQQRTDFAAADKKRAKKAGRLRSGAFDRNPLMAFLGKHGISSTLASEFAPGPAERRKAIVPGYGPIFRRAGLNLDLLAERAAEEGFLPPGSRDDRALYSLIQRAMRGERVIPQYAEGAVEAQAEAENRARFEDYQEADPLAPADMEEAIQAAADNPQEAAELRALLAQAEAEGIDAETVLEEAARITENGSQEQYHAAAQDLIRRALAQDTGSRRQDAAGQGADGRSRQEAEPGRGGESRQTAGRTVAEAGTEPALTAPTPEDIVAQQDRAETAPARDQRDQVRKESEAGAGLFSLTQEDGRQDTTGDLFGTPAAETEKAQESVDDLRKQLRDLEDRMVGAAGLAPGFVEEAVRSRKVPADMKARREELRQRIRDLQGKVDTARAAPAISDAEVDAKADQIMRLFDDMGGGIALTRDQVRALIVEKGMDAADKSVQAFQQKIKQDKATQEKLAKMKPAAEKPVSQMSAADLLRAAADKMEGKAEEPAAKPAEPTPPKTAPAEKPTEAEPQEPMFSRADQNNTLPVDDATEELVQESGEPVASIVDAERRMAAGERIFAMHEQSDTLSEITSVRQLKNWASDQLIALPPDASFSQGQLPAVITPSTVQRVQAAITELLGGKQLPNSLGRIVATTAAEIKSTWEPLIGKNLQIGSEGEAGIAQAFFDPRTKTVFLIADNIPAGDEMAVLAHELMHKWGIQVLGKDGWDKLHGVINSWANSPEDSDERAVYNYARSRVEAVGMELSSQEMFPYAVEAAIKIGVKPSMQASRGTAARWLESVRQNLKMVWAKITGKPETFKAQDLVDLAFGIAQMENPESAQALRGTLDDTKAEQNALRALSENDELFALPKSDKTTVEEIAAENDPDIKVRQTKIGGETLYTLTMPGGETAKLWVREPSPYGEKIYSMELVDGDRSNVEIGRPGENPEDVDPATEDVYLDVSNLKPGQSGYTAYNIAATFAHNTGRIFIGDPSGLSDKAMRRRLENMISTALKFGTTDHIAPHPKQVRGDAKIGVPPLKWVYGDSLGNIRRMIDVSLKAEENSGNPPKIYDPRTGNFSEESARLPVEAPGGRLEQVAGPATGGLQRVQSETELGRRTRARAAIFRALLREEGEGGSGAQRGRDGILAGLVRVADQFPDSTRKIFYSRRVIVGETTRKHTPAQLRAMRNVGFEIEVPTLKERAQALWQDAGKKLAQGIVDQFAPVKDLDKEAYGLLRLAKGASGAFEVFLHGGKLKLTDGVYDFDDQNKGGVVERLLLPLQGEHHDFFRWIAANRAERLTAEGRENLFTAQDIADLKTLADGTTDFDYTVQTGPRAGTVTRDRTLIYADSQRVFNEFNKNVLDLSEQSGLIDGASRNLWENEFYVPFYRVADEDGGVRGANIKSGVVRQEAFKKLKGGTQELNADLLDNTLMNWAHLLDAAAKNRAAKATIEAAEKLGAATQVPDGTKKSVWFMDGGQKHHAVIDDPYLLTAITSLEYAGMRNPVMNAMGAFKHYLTIGVTASPFFKIRNLIRDSVQVLATSSINPNPAGNVARGWALTDPKSDAYMRLMAGGGTIHFGTMLEGSEAKRVQALVESGVDQATILDSDKKVKAFYRRFIEPGITAYNELGNRGEAINRASLYDQLRNQGMSHAEASLQARDLMDFSMQGSFTTIRFLTQVVPFFNARLQGMYKLGRSAKEDPKRMAAVVGAVTLMSLALLAAYGDDDDWKKREEWDRNGFWFFKFGGTAFRIPKPFEIGAMATLAERGFELMFDKEMTGKRFRKQVLTLLGDNLSMNPIPQLVKPVLDIYANKDSFTGRPIETMGMDRLEAEYRFTNRTSMLARGASTAANAVTGLAGIESPSPVQIDHMLRGYFGWLGAFVVGSADTMLRPMTGQPERASPDLWKVATGGMVGDVDSASSRYVSQMYEQAKEIERAYATWRNLVKEGKTLEAGEYLQEHRDDIRKHRGVSAVKAQESRLNQRIRMIERSSMDADKKRDQIKKLQQQKDSIARRLTQ